MSYVELRLCRFLKQLRLKRWWRAVEVAAYAIDIAVFALNAITSCRNHRVATIHLRTVFRFVSTVMRK
jgi:hypothetical protein